MKMSKPSIEILFWLWVSFKAEFWINYPKFCVKTDFKRKVKYEFISSIGQVQQIVENKKKYIYNWLTIHNSSVSTLLEDGHSSEPITTSSNSVKEHACTHNTRNAYTIHQQHI